MLVIAIAMRLVLMVVRVSRVANKTDVACATSARYVHARARCPWNSSFDVHSDARKRSRLPVFNVI